MWLLNVHTLKLKAYLSTKDRPKYAILSHTWGEEEVLFSHVENLETPDLEKLKGYTKVKSSCLQARKDAYEWIWIDTCCINKDSSAELSEAINSMWAWYRHSDVCYAFLSDARKGKRDSIRASRWMKRGWTMQELIAPSQVRFFDMNWNELGDRLGMASLLSEVTRIDRSVLSRNQAPGHTHNIQAGVLCVLCGKPAEVERILDQISIASKMSWSARRETTRSEDRSYSLLGLFGVNMPLLYGEGGPSAWQRLQEEIIKKTYDQSILAFDNRQIYRLPGNGPPMTVTRTWSRSGMYAEHADRFVTNVQLPEDSSSKKKMKLVAGDLILDIWVCPLTLKDFRSSSKQRAWDNLHIGLLDCKVDGDAFSWPAIVLRCVSLSNNEYIRERTELLLVDRKDPPTLKSCRHARRDDSESDLVALNMTYDLQFASLKQITILNRSPSLPFTSVRHSARYSKPTQIMPIVQREPLQYKLDSSYPGRQGNFIEKIPVFWSGVHQVMGMAIFSNNNQQPFMVAWGPSERKDGTVGSWCKLSAVNQADATDYKNQKSDLAEILRSKAWDTNESLKLQDLKIGDSRLWKKDAVAFGDIYVSVDIEEVKALDREIWQLQIQISPIRRREEDKKSDGRGSRHGKTLRTDEDASGKEKP